jgi:hypothetical protein
VKKQWAKKRRRWEKTRYKRRQPQTKETSRALFASNLDRSKKEFGKSDRSYK